MKSLCSAITAMVLMAVMATTGAAAEKKEDRPGGAIIEASTITSTVESIDYKTRTVTLRGEKGGIVSFIAGDEVRNLDQVKKGDLVTFEYFEGVAVDVQKASEAPKMVESQSITRAKKGEKPAGTVETTGFMTATVEEIDYTTRMVTLKLPEGNTLRFKAGDQVKRLNEIKKGDEIVMQYKQKVSIRVTTPEKKTGAGAGTK